MEDYEVLIFEWDSYERAVLKAIKDGIIKESISTTDNFLESLTIPEEERITLFNNKK